MLRSVMYRTLGLWRNRAVSMTIPTLSSSVSSSATASTTTTTTKTAAVTTTLWRSFSSTNLTTGGKWMTTLKQENPHVDVVQYEHKNRTWTVHHVEYYSEALAIGLAENGLVPGDVVLSWLPAHFQESMALQFACSKAGFVLYELDPATAIDDPEKAKEQLAAALTLTNANVLVSQEAGSDVNYVRLGEQVIPELRVFNYGYGMPFLTPRYPHLRFCLHTGYDQEDKWGWLLLKHFVVPSENLDTLVDTSKLTASTPLAGKFKFDSNGIPTAVDTPLTNAQVFETGIWPTYNKILKKEFHKVEGVGVIF